MKFHLRMHRDLKCFFLCRYFKEHIKQGRIHGYPSRVRVGRGSDEIDQLDGWAGAVTPKPPLNAKKS